MKALANKRIGINALIDKNPEAAWLKHENYTH
jgi:hypothetical protein